MAAPLSYCQYNLSNLPNHMFNYDDNRSKFNITIDDSQLQTRRIQLQISQLVTPSLPANEKTGRSPGVKSVCMFRVPIVKEVMHLTPDFWGP